MIKRNFHLLFLAAVLLGALPAMAQVGDGVLEPFHAPAFSPERQIHMKVKNGPFGVLTGKFTLPPGGQIDWHDHPGSGVITVLEGEFTEYKENGCVLFHTKDLDAVFFETQGEVHKVVNTHEEIPAVGLITFFLPVGMSPITPVGPPPERPCAPGDGKEPNERPSLEDIQAKIAANSDAIQKIHDLLTNLTRTLPFRR